MKQTMFKRIIPGKKFMNYSIKHNAIKLTLLAGVSIASLFATNAFAQNANDKDKVEEVVVTAERRSQRLQDVPISATVFTASELTRKGIANVADIQQVSPSIAINTVNRSVFINIRGVGIAQSAPTSNPGVAYYIDGQLIPHEQFIAQSFFDMGSLEVLRGPQGTLTGQNSTGGAIYARSPAPKFGENSAYVEGTFGDYSRTKYVAAFNVGLGDNFALRVAGVREERDSYTKNIATNATSQPGNVDLSAIRANLAFRSNDDRLTANLRYEYFHYDTDNNAVKRRNDTISADPFVIQEDALSYLRQTGYRASFEANYQLTGGIKIRYINSFQDGKTVDQTDGDRSATALPRIQPATSGNTGRVSYARTGFDTRIHELNLISTSDSPFQWVLGAFMLDEDVPVDLLRDNFNTTNFVAATNITQTLAVNSTRSVFGQGNWKINDRFEVFLGLRTSTDKQVYNKYYISLNNPTLAALPAPGTGFGVQESDQMTGKVGLNYRTEDGTLFYLTVSQGYKAGGVNLTAGTPNFGPETNVVSEIGMKSKFLDDHLTLNLSAFDSDYQDIQLSSLVGGLPVTQNATSGKARGFEVEGVYRNAGWNMNFGVGYLDAQFAAGACISDTNSPGTDTGCATNLRFVPEGRELPFSPKWTLNAGIQYRFELANSMSLTPRVQWSHLSEQWATPFQYTATFVPERDVFDARVTLDINSAIQAEAFVNNFTDETYIASQIQSSSSADGGIIYGAPRTYGVRLLYRFGE